ncbi:hypothetical protein [Streptomyces sp. NPDC059753]|uniref:hypothetical protein n=1 Tax=Streptomyces sp. NPDC059753 TaxID=3346933 RepID=UPI003656B999
MEPTTHEVTVPARQLRVGDVFTLHGHERTAADYPWPAGAGSVSLAFIGGGYAVVPAERPIVVRRSARRAA